MQLSATLSQYWPEVHAVVVWLEPLALQATTELPEQDFAFGVQT